MVSTLRSPARQNLAGPWRLRPRGSRDAELIIANAPDPMFVSDLEGKILLANTGAAELLGLRPHKLLEESLSRCISPGEQRAFMAALRTVVEHRVTRNVVLHARSASGEVISTTLNASALHDSAGSVIGTIGILRVMCDYGKILRDLEALKAELQEKTLELEKFQEVVVIRELKMIALETTIENLKREVRDCKAELGRT